MLLPALYVQQRDSKAVFKKFSFEKAKADFKNEEWEIMNEVSAIRQRWNQKNVSLHAEKLAARFVIVPLLSKFFRAKVTNDLKQKINEDFLKRMNQLTESMRKKIEQKEK